jgi:hypothetical protein
MITGCEKNALFPMTCDPMFYSLRVQFGTIAFSRSESELHLRATGKWQFSAIAPLAADRWVRSSTRVFTRPASPVLLIARHGSSNRNYTG